MSYNHTSPLKSSTHQKGEKSFKASSSNSVSNSVAAVVSTLLNAQRAGQKNIQLSPNRCGGIILPILTILRNEGYIQGVKLTKKSATFEKTNVTVYLRYDGRGQPGIRDLRSVSLPSRRLYLPASAL